MVSQSDRPSNTDEDGLMHGSAVVSLRDAWKQVGGMSTEEAMAQYADVLTAAVPDWEVCIDGSLTS